MRLPDMAIHTPSCSPYLVALRAPVVECLLPLLIKAFKWNGSVNSPTPLLGVGNGVGGASAFMKSAKLLVEDSIETCG